MKKCLVTMNLDVFKMLNAGNEIDCGLPALKEVDFCLYHFARYLVEQIERDSRWEFRVKIEEPEPVS